MFSTSFAGPSHAGMSHPKDITPNYVRLSPSELEPVGHQKAPSIRSSVQHFSAQQRGQGEGALCASNFHHRAWPWEHVQEAGGTAMAFSSSRLSQVPHFFLFDVLCASAQSARSCALCHRSTQAESPEHSPAFSPPGQPSVFIHLLSLFPH